MIKAEESIKVETEVGGLVRDIHSKALLSNDRSKLSMSRARRKTTEVINKRIDNLEKKIDLLINHMMSKEKE
jgi:hypothetical protein